MSKEKQIEEMASDIEKSGMLDSRSRCRIVAEELYVKGYRKQSEGEWISVEERLPPDKHGVYVVLLTDGEFEDNAKAVAEAIDKTPTADVAPKEEVDRLRFNLKAVLDERTVDKAEVAEEIFAEIRQYWSRRLFDCVDFSFKDFAFDGFAGDLDELYKKYTEDNK